MQLIATNPLQRKVLVNVDGAQAEARVVARLCKALFGKSRFDELFESGRSIHKCVASIIYKVPEDSIKKDNQPGAMYYTAKRAVHAYDNGMGPGKFAILTRKPLHEAETLLKTCAKEFPEVADGYHPWVRTNLHKSRTLINSYKRPHTFLGRLDDKTYRSGYTFYQQSSIGDHVILAYDDFAELVKPEWQVELLLTTYDSITYQVLADPDIVWASFQLVKELMERPLAIQQLSLVVPCEASLGRSYRGLYPFKSLDAISRLLRKLRYHDASKVSRLHSCLYDSHSKAGKP